MSAFTSFWKPKGGSFGLQLVSTGIEIGTGGIAVAPSATTSVILPKPYRKCQLLSLSIQVTTAAIGGGAITAQAFKRVSAADKTLTATSDLTATQFTTLQVSYKFPITAGDKDTIFALADTCRIDLVAASTVSTAPQLVIQAEWAVLA